MRVWSRHENKLYNRLYRESVDNHRTGYDGFGKKLPDKPTVELHKQMPMNLKQANPSTVITDLPFIEDILDKADRLPADTSYEVYTNTIMDLSSAEVISIFDSLQKASLNKFFPKDFNSDIEHTIKTLKDSTVVTC